MHHMIQTETMQRSEFNELNVGDDQSKQENLLRFVQISSYACILIANARLQTSGT